MGAEFHGDANGLKTERRFIFSSRVFRGVYHHDVHDGHGVQFDLPNEHHAEHIDDDHRYAKKNQRCGVKIEAEKHGRDEKDSGQRKRQVNE